MKKLLLLALLLKGRAFAADCVISLTSEDGKAGASSANSPNQPPIGLQRFILKVEGRSVERYDGEPGLPYPLITRYAIKGGFLVIGTHVLSRASHILAQSEMGVADVVIFERGASSFGSPAKIFKALSGHPEQIEEAWIAIIQGEAVQWSQRLSAIQSSRVRLYAQLFTPNTAQTPK